MTYLGRVKKGVIVLNDPTELPEGLEVTIVIPPQPPSNTPALGRRSPSLLKFVGCIDDLPPDASERYEEYLYGHADESRQP